MSYENDDYVPKSLKKVTILSATTIRNYAFEGCSSLTSITIPNSVTSIGEDAFNGCSSLTGVYITDIAAWCNISFDNSLANPLRYANNLYINNKLMTELIIPYGVRTIGDYALYNCSSLTSITIPNSVRWIGSYAFKGCSSLTSITIPDSVTSIGGYAFSGCSSLTSVVIPDSVTSIGSYAFNYCSNLTSVVIGNGVTSIGDYAFYNCSSLTSVVIGNGVTSIGDYAFYNCNSLTSIYYKGTADEWAKISIVASGNSALVNATRYYYTEREPALNSAGTAYGGKYWRYVDGVATPWVYEKRDEFI